MAEGPCFSTAHIAQHSRFYPNPREGGGGAPARQRDAAQHLPAQPLTLIFENFAQFCFAVV